MHVVLKGLNRDQMYILHTAISGLHQTLQVDIILGGVWQGEDLHAKRNWHLG